MRTGPFWIVIMLIVLLITLQYFLESDWRERNGKPPIFQKK